MNCEAALAISAAAEEAEELEEEELEEGEVDRAKGFCELVG